MKKVPVFVFLFFLILQGGYAQSVQFNLTDSIRVLAHGDTLKNAWAGGINTPLFSEVDLNGDGIHDLFLFDKANSRISTFLNDGSPGVKAWHYAPYYISKFPPVNSWALLYDYNCDGKADFFTLAPSTSGLSVYRNDFDSALGGLRFTLVVPELQEEIFTGFFGPLFTSTVTMPAFGDVDGDGDMDILGFSPSPDGRVWFHRNYSVEHSHGCDSLEFKLESMTWGNFAVSQNSGGDAQVACFSCRTAKPDYTGSELTDYDQSVAAPRDDSIFSIFMLDNDGDGDMDLIIGDSGALNSCLVVNGGTPAVANMVSQDLYYPPNTDSAYFCTFHFHAYIDVDNDNIRDLLVAPADLEDYKSVWFYKNTGTNSAPVFVFQTSTFLIDQMIDVGEAACPVLFDADADGLEDLVVGRYGFFQCGPGIFTNGLSLYKNTGTLAFPAFNLVDTNYAGIGSLNGITGPVYPAFGDLDGDGDKDMIIGSDNGKLIYFNNSAGAGNPATFPVPITNYMGIDVGVASTPQLIDLNRDGKLDLVIGAQNGHVNYFENTGTTTVPFFTTTATNNTLGGIVITTPGFLYAYTVPYVFVDQSQYKLLVGCEGGEVYLYDSLDGNLNGNFRLVDSIIDRTQGFRPGFNLAVSGGDLNNDGLTDVLLGIYGGGVNVYLHYNPGVGIQPVSATGSDFVIAPNPADEQCSVFFHDLFPGSHQLTVTNYLGQQLFSKTVKAERFIFDTHEFPSGIYLVQVLSSGNSFIRKLVVKH